MSDAADRRAELVDRARVQERAIGQLLLDAERWNRVHPTSERIDIDPDGSLVKMREQLRTMLDRERPDA